MWQIEESLRRLFKEVETIYGPLNFVALIPNEGEPSLVDILVCADWFPKSDKETVTFLVKKVLSRLDKTVLLKISAIIPINQNSPLNTSTEHLESMIAQYFNLEKEQINILIPEEAQTFLGLDGQYHPKGSILGLDGQYHPPGSILGVDGKYHPPGSILGLDGQYHPKGSILGVDGKYHPKGSYLGPFGEYIEPPESE